MRDAGSSLVETLEYYLPSESQKLSTIGSKVLDIFYEEFIKLVPAYILKREEEKEEKHPQDHQPHKKTNKTSKMPNSGKIPILRQTTAKKPSGVPRDITLTEASDNNFSEMIGFNERRDQQDLEINELELFIKEKFQRF